VACLEEVLSFVLLRLMDLLLMFLDFLWKELIYHFGRCVYDVNVSCSILLMMVGFGCMIPVVGCLESQMNQSL
jgi:hypothetical protein